ncbi:sensor histidine kinase [Amycolatopsis sp. CA-230715]|uniref:sensor histidine kinase n=1 Tax=Amycolatopsis sp. CA-230715 TaxID=2745196 RepID=UPI001C01D2B7|nr:sensor histidine kinase [Amycolatopsis sp. CA-230715]QWF80403.1 hypothetical protein HUW46_03824 [Amycolatopsis sp. CA-230715]
MTRYAQSVARSFALAGYAVVLLVPLLAAIASFALMCVGLVFFVVPVLLWARRGSAVLRRLVTAWCGVAVTAPYRPEPRPPERQADGWYREGNSLFRGPFWITVTRRVEWVIEDPATGRELLWLLLNPIAGLLLPIATLVTGPVGLTLYGRWVARLLGPREDEHRWGPVRWVKGFAHLLGFLVLSLVMLALGAVALVTIVVLVVPAPYTALIVRAVANAYRAVARDWVGAPIARPYRPEPPFPVPRSDGMYQHRQQLYETPWTPAYAARLEWVLRDGATWRDLLAGFVTPITALVLCAVPAGLLGYGGFEIFRALRGERPWWLILAGIAAALIGLAVSPVLARWQALAAKWLLRPTEAARLVQRVKRVEATRTDATVAQAEELRRIERDLHDGVQSRLVAMGMKLGAVEALIDTDPEAAKKLAAELRESSSATLTELRQLVRGIHPPVLSERGLADAVRALALDSPLKVAVAVDLPGRIERPVEGSVYFAVAELLGNAAKHGAHHAEIGLDHRDDLLRVVVTDDGDGGADPARGTGLRGIERRLGAFDGKFALTSPPGGPTKVLMEIPCQLDPEPSSPRTSTSSGTA